MLKKIEKGEGMRILSVTAQKPDSTGSGVYLAGLVRAFAALGHEQAVVCGAAPEDHPVRSLPRGIQVHAVRFETPDLPFRIAGMSDDMPYPSTRYSDFTPEMLKMFKTAFANEVERAIRDFEPDFIICHHLYLVTSVVSHLPHECPVVGVCHGTCLRQLGKHDLDGAFIREGVRSLDRILALTDTQVDTIERIFGKCDGGDGREPLPPISVVGTGYDSGLFHMSAGPRPQGRQLLYVGKIADQKGVPSLLHALESLPWQASDLKVRLVGGGKEEHPDIVEAAKASRFAIDLPGKMGQEDLARLYQSSQVLVLPSFYEGLPLVLAEALACGCVVVCTDLPGVRSWLLGAVPDAPAVFVKPPRMRSVDVPFEEDLPSFERDLAAAIEKAFSMAEHLAASLPEGQCSCSVESLSWDGLAARILQVCGY